MGTRKNRLAEAVLTSTHNLCFEQKCEKYQNFLSENFSFFGCKIFNIFDQARFRNGRALAHMVLYAGLKVLKGLPFRVFVDYSH